VHRERRCQSAAKCGSLDRHDLVSPGG
jgi:hypothetical protein